MLVHRAARYSRGYRTSFVLGGVFLCCCSETPIDALLLDAVSGGPPAPGGQSGSGGTPSGGSGGVPSVAGAGGFPIGEGGTISIPPPFPEAGAGGATACPAPVPMAWVGRFSIRSRLSQRCLHQGPETALMTPGPHEVAYSLEFSEECSSAEWELIASQAPVGSYIVRSREIADRDLDMELGATDSGTRAILYAPVAGLHQRFYFRERGPSKFEILPAHTVNKCIAETPGGPEIATCSSTNDAQTWELIADPCKTQ